MFVTSFRLSFVTARQSIQQLRYASQFNHKHYNTPSTAYLKLFFDKYVCAYNALSDIKRETTYAAETVDQIKAIDEGIVHAHVVESQSGELVGGALLLELRTENGLHKLNQFMGAEVHQSIVNAVTAIPDWQEKGVYYQKGSFKLPAMDGYNSKHSVKELYEKTFLHPSGIHMYSTLPPIHAKIEAMFPDVSYVPLGTEMRMDKSYTYYMSIIP